MTLSRLSIPHILNTSEHNFSRDFYTPCLKESTEYSRGVGFFTSGWLESNLQGMKAFAQSQGYARFITSPILEEKDWDAISQGYEARYSRDLEKSMKFDLEKISNKLGESLSTLLSWLVYDGILDFRFAVPHSNLSGDFHDKFGIFRDVSGNCISFNGSYNDSAKGLRNYESIKIFRSWIQHEQEDTEHDLARFERLWEGNDPNLNVYPIPAALKEKIIEIRSHASRPYKAPTVSSSNGRPSLGEKIELRPYQKAAIRKFFENDGCGLFEMATGTGKTFTALAALVKLFDALRENGRSVFPVIVCPFTNLVDQWADEMRQFGFEPLKCYDSRGKWEGTFTHLVTQCNRSGNSCSAIITTTSTFRLHISPRLDEVRLPIAIIIDEMHNFSSERLRASLPLARFRLGLSATPEIWFNSEVTKELTDYFKGIVFRLGLSEAIEGKFLTPYKYHPIAISLTDEEYSLYSDLTAKIGRVLQAGDDLDTPSDALSILLSKRARVLSMAANKLPELKRVFSTKAGHRFNLIYCGSGAPLGEGDDDEQRQVNKVLNLLGNELKISANKYTSGESAVERRRILNEFRYGRLDAIVSIRCLDEGIDIPEIRSAFILSSYVNPRQWIQRRGRILRKAEGKEFAEIFDFLTIPPLSERCTDTERSLVRRELIRASEFAKDALNGPLAEAELLPLKRNFRLMDI